MNYLFAYEAELMMKDGFIREGIELCKKGLKEYPTYTVAYSVLANGYLLLNDFDSAFTTIEAALGRYPDNKSLLNIRSKLEDIFKSDNKFLIGDSVVKDYAIEQKFPEDKELIYKPDILTDAEIENKFHDYKSGNVILTDFTVTPFISPEFSTDLYNQVNNFENLRDLIASFKEEKQETVENIQVVEVDETSDKIEIKE
ncbi:MAG: hypothetical protein HZB41_05530, partial [Ignavibacteriae bacterium]|nr:hypothetical protein [Ignavibacteriota bacterium]